MLKNIKNIMSSSLTFEDIH